MASDDIGRSQYDTPLLSGAHSVMHCTGNLPVCLRLKARFFFRLKIYLKKQGYNEMVDFSHSFKKTKSVHLYSVILQGTCDNQATPQMQQHIWGLIQLLVLNLKTKFIE